MCYCPLLTKEQVKEVLNRVSTWPQERQEELAEIALEIEACMVRGEYHATPDELRAIEDAERSGIASEEDVEAAFRSFRRE